MAPRLFNHNCGLMFRRALYRNSFPSQAHHQHIRMASSLPTDEVILNRVINKGVITLNRPQALNALNLSMIRSIFNQFRKWEMDNEMRMFIIKANGDKAFCAGGDVKSIALDKEGKLKQEFFYEEYRMNNTLGTTYLPVLSLIDGICMGGGVGLSVHGTFRVVSEKAMFSMPETALGFFPDVGGSHFLPRLPGKLGIFLALTGTRLYGRDIYKAGVATHFIPSDKFKAVEADIMNPVNETYDTVQIAKILQKYQDQWEEDYKKEFSLKKYIGRINHCFGGKSVEEIIENLKRDSSDWAKLQLDTLSKMSPTSLKVTFKLLKEGIDLTLSECLKREYRLSQRFMANKDFYEGVRSILIDKDHNPKWSPSRLEDVTDEVVESYFAPLPQEKELRI